MSAPILLGLRILITFALYAFVGWGLYLMWRTLKSQAEILNAPGIPTLYLKLPTEQGEKTIIIQEKSEALIGRDGECDLCVTDTAVSARHARFSYHHKQWWLEDLGSTNGTHINDEPLKTPVILVEGDVVRCGNSVLFISFESKSEYPSDEHLFFQETIS